MSDVSRRRFMQTTAAVVAATPVIASAADEKAPKDLNGRIFKTLKIGMVKVKGSLTDKFKAAKAAGFDGIEMNSPGSSLRHRRSKTGTSPWLTSGE